MAQLFKIIGALLIFFTSLYSQPLHIQFDHITTKDGLSHNMVNAILKDSKGFMWFGTKDGLNRYDGYDFKVYKYDPQDSTSISGNFITSIYEDREGLLWIGTYKSGFNIFNRKSNKFIRYKFDEGLYPKSRVNAICLFFEDPADSIRVMWIGLLLHQLPIMMCIITGTMIGVFQVMRILVSMIPGWRLLMRTWLQSPFLSPVSSR